MKLKKSVIAAAVSLGVVVGSAGAAQAAGQDSGYKSCSGTGSTVATRGVASGKQTHYQNSLFQGFATSGATVTIRVWNPGFTTSNWKVYTDGAIDMTDTYAYCPG